MHQLAWAVLKSGESSVKKPFGRQAFWLICTNMKGFLFIPYNYSVCKLRGAHWHKSRRDLWGKLDLHYFLTRIKWRPCGYMNSLVGGNRWAWMCSLGKLSVTSVSSKFWWSQPINRGWGEVGVGRPVHSPQPKPRQKCLCLEMGSGRPAASRLALIVTIQNGECGLQAICTPQWG